MGIKVWADVECDHSSWTKTFDHYKCGAKARAVIDLTLLDMISYTNLADGWVVVPDHGEGLAKVHYFYCPEHSKKYSK